MSDSMQVLNPVSAATDYAITYLDENWALAALGNADMKGWYKADLSAPMDNEAFAAEQGFLASFGSPTIKITFTGAVNPAKEATVDSKGTKYPMIANFLPRQIQWKELTPTGFDPMSDSLQVLNPVSAATDYAITYLDENWALAALGNADMKGWYKADLSAPMDDEYIDPGAAFLASFGSKAITIKFPTAIK